MQQGYVEQQPPDASQWKHPLCWTCVPCLKKIEIFLYKLYK